MAISEHIRVSIVRNLSMFLDSRGFTDSQINVSSLAELLDTNRVYLTCVVKKEYGLSVTGLIAKRRVEYAKSLIMHETHPLRVKELAARSGFRSSTSFYRTFLRLEGCPPSDWIATNSRQ